ncbi:hypothetical protein HHI36_005234 [Cryptolaemus montrouzieri]|uniref:Uncharacterized protein n=1 Tax=Cryptolaemus montrouzieri TaxID=559131 RepID=A0ABD2NTJ0_9CUCU
MTSLGYSYIVGHEVIVPPVYKNLYSDEAIRAVFNILKMLFYADSSCQKLQDYIEIFDKTHVYNVYTDVNSPFSAVKQVSIGDVTSERTTEILIHANPSFDPAGESVFLELESLTRFEKRFYKINFYES